jgi:hypothetical protein
MSSLSGFGEEMLQAVGLSRRGGFDVWRQASGSGGFLQRIGIGTSERPTLLKLTSICIYIKKTHFLVL